MAARDLRCSWFLLLEEHSMDFLAISHNLNDSVETLMINLLRVPVFEDSPVSGVPTDPLYVPALRYQT